MITRMDRGGRLAVAIRGEAPFALAPVVKDTIKVKPGGKIELMVKLTRSKDFKDAVQVYSASANFGPRPQGGQPAAAIGGIAADKDAVKLSLDVPANLPPGPHTLVLRGVAGATAPKPGGQGQRIPMSYPTLPIAIEVEGKTVPKKRMPGPECSAPPSSTLPVSTDTATSISANSRRTWATTTNSRRPP